MLRYGTTAEVSKRKTVAPIIPVKLQASEVLPTMS